MARVIRSFSFVERVKPRKYDWDKLLDGRIWRLVQGQDFDVSAYTFCTTANVAGRRQGGVCRTSVSGDGDVVVLQFFKAR